MADAFRPKVSTSSSIKAAYGVKVKNSRLTAPKNQQSPGATQTSVLPRIDRRGELPQKPHAPLLRPSPTSAKNGGLSILLPPQRPSSKDAVPNVEISPTYHDDEFDGLSAKAAWGTPRNPAPELPTGSRVASFFAATEGSGDNDDSSISIPTPLRLQSVEDSISANEEKYRVDMEQLASNNNKFFEISMSANQHLEHMHNQLPNISEAFNQTDSALLSLSSDIATLHQQHKSAMNDMENRLEVAMSNNADEMVTLSESHASEKAEILEAHERDLKKANEDFREKVSELERRHIEVKKKFLDELQELRQTSESRIQALQELNRAEKEEHKQSAKTALEALQKKAQQELDDLRSSTQAAYTELQTRSEAEFAELQRTSAEKLAAAKTSLTAEIVSLKRSAADNFAALANRSERELQEHREQSNESLQHLKVFYAQEREYLLEKAAEEVARLRMYEIEQSTRMENRRCQETKALEFELKATKAESSTQIEKLHRSYTSELETLKATTEAEKKLLLQTHAKKIEGTLAAATQELSQAISSYEDKLHFMAEAHATEVTRNKETAAHAMDDLVIKYESDLASLQNERAREKDALILHYETELETLKQKSREDHDKNVQRHETQVLQLREVHSSKVLSLEIAMREQSKKAEDIIREKNAELESKQERINLLEASEIVQNEHHKQYAERSLEIIEQKNMALSELESEIWRLDQLILEKDLMLDSTNRALKVAEEDVQVKASTILELTFVIKSRDDEIEKLRNALLDTVQTVNTKTEILELTTETLSSKAKELEATKNALRLESGKLSMVEESMNQKVGILENTELKMESMRLNMENMRLEMKRMQMDMKLQLEHTEGEIELKNGEIRRLHGSQSELKQKNDFCQQTIERLEESLVFSQRQGEEAQRRIELLRLEATQAAEDMKKVCDDLLSKEQDVVIITREKQTITTEKQRLQIQFNNLTQTAQTLHERVELYTMQAEEVQCQYQRLLHKTTAEKEERIRSEKHLHMLELSAAKDVIRHLEGVEERLSASASQLEMVVSEKQHLQAEIKTLNETLHKYENSDRELHTANGNIELENKILESKNQELVELNKRLYKSENGVRHQLDMSRMEIEDSISAAWRLVRDKDKVIQLNRSLEVNILNLHIEKEQLMLSLGQEKREIVSRVEDLQEKIAGLRKDGAQAASEISDLQHALSEKKKELEYLQENLGEQTTDTRKIKTMLDTLSSAHTELQAQLASLSRQRQKEEEEHLDTIQSLQENVDHKSRQCEALQQSLGIQHQEINLLMVQHDSHVMQLTDGHRSEAVQLIESHRAQIAQITEEHLKLADGHLDQVTKLKEKHIVEINQMTKEHESEVTRLTDQISQLVEEHRTEISQLQKTHQADFDRLTDNLHYQVSELTVDRLSQITEQAEMHRTEVDQLIRDHDKEVTTLMTSHEVQFNQMTDDHRYQVSELTVDRLSYMTEQTKELRLLLSRLEVDHDAEVAQLKEHHQSEIDRLIGTYQNSVNGNQQHMLLQRATDEQIRVICAHTLELITVQVEHQQNIGQMEQYVLQIEQFYHKRLAELQLRNAHLAVEHSQTLAAIKWLKVLVNVENTQTLKGLKSEYAQTVVAMKQQHKTEMEAARQSAYERHEQALADHKRVVDELNETFTQNSEMVHLHSAKEHLRRVNELLERSRVEEEHFHKELSDKSDAMTTFEDVVTALKVEISELQTQLQDMKQAVSERDALVVAKNATIDNIRKELTHLLETGNNTESNEQFTALIRQRLETHMMEVYHVELNELKDFTLKDENDLLGCLKGFIAMRCYRGVVPQAPTRYSEVANRMTSIDEVRERLQEYDRVIAALDQEQVVSDDSNVDRTPSRQIASLLSDFGRLKFHVDKVFISTSDIADNEVINTNAMIQLLDNLTSLFDRLAIPKELENAFIRGRKLITILNENERLILNAKSSSIKDGIQSMDDVGRLFNVIDQILARAREVTKSDKFVRLEDMELLFDEWEALHKELDDSNSGDNNRQEPSLDVATGNYLRSVEILASKEEAADFVERCKNALLLPDDMFAPDDIVEAIEQLMKILQHFELLQPKLGSPRRQPAATDPPPTLENKVTAVLAFVEELQLIADFAQNILNDESKNEDDPASNENSRSNLEALRALTRTPSPALTLDELQFDVDAAVDDTMQAFDQNLCEFSNEGDKQQGDFFSSSESKVSSRSPPSPFLADSLIDISLVMSDHHRLLSQTTPWVVNSRHGGTRSHAFSVGAEISRLVRNHCGLLSLSRRLFKMKDPQQELVSLLEGVALLERMVGRLAIFPARDTDETSIHSFSDSVTSLGKSSSIESISHPVLASIGDTTRYLQDYDYFLRHVKLDGWTNQENNSPAPINIEMLVQEINERVMLVDQSKELLELQNPVEELPPLLIGAQEVLRQAKQLRESSVCFEESRVKSGDEPHQGEAIGHTENGFEALLSEMDAIVDDLRGYNEMLAWLRQVLPHPESVKSITDLKDRVKGVLTEVEILTTNNTNLMQDSTSLTSALEQMKQTRDHLVEESSKEGALLQELAALEVQALLSPVDEVSTRIELVQTLIKQQQRACDDAQQRRADMLTETAFLQQHGLLSVQMDGSNENFLSMNTRLEIYTRLLQRAENIQSEKIEMVSSLIEEIKQKSEKLESVAGELAQTRQEVKNAFAEERAFLASKEIFSSFLSIDHTVDEAFSRINVYQQLYDEITLLSDEKFAVEAYAAHEHEFLRTNELLPQNDSAVNETAVPATPVMSSIRLEVFQRLHDSLTQLRQHEEDLTQEDRFLQENSLVFDLNEPLKSRLAVYETLLAGQNALIEEKMEREVTIESEKAFLASHGVCDFENPMDIYEQFIEIRKQLAHWTAELEEELRFLTENQLYTSNELSDGSASLIIPFSSSFRLLVYRKFIQNEAQARDTIQKLKETMEQQLVRQIADDECTVTLLTAKIERLETSLMGWQESVYASQREWDRMLLEEEDKRRSLIRQHEEAQKQAADEYAQTLEEITKSRDCVVALASATHEEALKEATENHERRLAAELHKQAQQFELAAFVHAENEARKETSDSSTTHSSTSISAAQSRAYLLEKLAKRDTTAISMIYKAIRLTTGILNAAPTTSATTMLTSTQRTSEVSTDVTQTVLACVTELKTLKEFLVQSLEQIAKDDDQVPPSFAKAPYTKWMADAVTRATADTDCAIDLALCSHREFMSFAEVQLLTRQEEAEKALTRVYGILKTAATNGGFTPDQEKQLSLELEVTREREARENVACKFRLNEEYYRRLLDERKEMEIAQSANVEGLREECKTLRLKLEKLEQQIQQQSVLQQFRPLSSSIYTLSPRAPVASPQTPRALKTAAISNVPMPMRPERPRGGGSTHKERFVSDLERETGQRRTNTVARRFNDLKPREDAITENPGSQLEQDFRAMQAMMASHHTPAMEPIIPTAMIAPATAPGSSLQNQELWYQGVRSIHYVSFFISIFHVPKQQLFRVEVFNSDTEQQQQTVYVTWTEMQAFLQESRKATRLGITLPADPEMAVTVSQHARGEIMDVLFERVRVYGDGTENILFGFE